MISCYNDYNGVIKYNNAGFTLIELIVAILIFAVGIIGIMKMHQASVQANNYSMQLTQAINIAQDRLEYLRGVGVNHADMTVAAHGPVIRTSMGLQYRVIWNVWIAPNTYSAGRTVSINVAWTDKNRNRSFIIPSVVLSP